MKINWTLRLKNKATLTTLLITVIAFVYTVLGIFGVVPSITQDQITDCALMVVQIICAFGIVVDPTTAGVSDSTQALEYEKPKISE